jgi:SAM-dependent methyltransferase
MWLKSRYFRSSNNLDVERPRKAFYWDFVRPGWPILNLLPYFYRGWYGTEDLRFLIDLFIGSIRERRKNKRDGIAVLGVCACGLIYEVAEFCDTVFGLDLSVEALLLAKRLLHGGEVALYFNFPESDSVICQEKITLRGPANKRSGIRLIAADVNRLPFSSQSLSCVITQYLLDIVPSRKALAREIHRVLSPEGVWINFALQLASAAADLSTALDLPQIFGVWASSYSRLQRTATTF